MSPTVREILKGTMFSDDSKTRGKRDSKATPPTGTTTHSTLADSRTATAPWEMEEVGFQKHGSHSETDSNSTEEFHAASARAAYQKFGLDYPCTFSFHTHLAP